MSLIANAGHHCPVLDKVEITDERLEYLKKHTPFSQWKTPGELGKKHGYVPKQIIRLSCDPRNNIAAIFSHRRWFILECSFDEYLAQRQNSSE